MSMNGANHRETDPLLEQEGRKDRDQPPPFAWSALVAMLCLGFIKPVCFDIIFPFINQMILEYGIVDSPEEVGFYSGIIESLFALLNLVTVLPWTYVSDRYGRKPVVLYGALGMAIATASFGFSKTYGMMIVTRCIGGAFAGTRSTMKVMLAELYTHKQHRISAFSAFQIAIRVGQVAGQSLGGLLSHPDKTMKAFDSAFWIKYPFALPGIVAGAFGLLTWMYCTVTLAETQPSRKTQHPEMSLEDDSNTLRDETAYVSYRSCLTPHVVSVLTNTFFMTIMSETFYALYPLYAFTPIASGGLGLSEADIGADMALRAVLIIIIITISSPIQHRFGALKTYQIGMAMWPASFMFLPILNWMVRTDKFGSGTPIYRLVFSLFYILWSIGALVWPSSQLIIVDSPPAPEALATVSGIAQIVQSLGQALSPAFVTSLFAFSVQSHILGGNLVYVILLLISALGAFQSFKLRESGEKHFIDARDHDTDDESDVSCGV